MEKDGERSAAHNVMPQHDQHFLLPVDRHMYAKPTPGVKAPFYYVTHRIADAPEKTIGTGIFPSKVVDLRRGLCPTLTSHSWPWVLDTLNGRLVMRQLIHVEVQHCYGLAMLGKDSLRRWTMCSGDARCLSASHRQWPTRAHMRSIWHSPLWTQRGRHRSIA